MSTHESVDCEVFDDNVDELALGHVDEPLRSRLLAHAATCSSCHSSLEHLGTVVDRLLLATPQIEPPAGFESRVLQRVHHPPVTAHSRRRYGRWLLPIAAAVGAFVAGGVLVATQIDHEPAAEAAEIVATDGTEIGSVRLVAEPLPHVVITIAAPRPDPGIRTCELRRTDGTWEQVGSWDASDIAAGAWAVGIDRSLLGATEMRITAGGDTLATATFG